MSVVERIGDLDNMSRLIIHRQEDGDIVVRVIQDEFGQLEIAEVEFCSPGPGGGQSPATHDALLKLVEAIKEDNKSGRFATTSTLAGGNRPDIFDPEPE